MGNASSLSISTDQVAALVEVARCGSLRAAAEALFITEQGVRNRLIALESQLGVSLYLKRRGPRRSSPLTPQGAQLLPRARALLERADDLRRLFQENSDAGEVDVVASQYLIAYVLIDVVRRFHLAHPHIRVRLSARTEQEIEEALLGSSEFAFGVAAPYDATPDLDYRHLFSMHWSLIASPRHPLLKRRSLRLADLTKYPLIVYERGSTGRQHVVEAFHEQGLSLDAEMEATNTDLIVRMVESGLGVSIVPLHASGAVTRGRRVVARSLGRQIRPIHSGLLLRKGEELSPTTQAFLRFLGQ